MATVYRALVFRAVLTKTSGRPFTRNFSTKMKFPKAKTACSQTAKAALCLTGVVGAFYYGRNKGWSREVLQKMKSMLILSTAAKNNDDAKSRKSVSDKIKAPAPCGPCKKKEKEKEECADCQPNITSPLKTYSLFLWITLEPTADPCAVVSAAIRLDEAIKAAEDPCGCSEEIIAGVGFGPNLLAQSLGPPCKNFCYRQRKGKNGELPVTDGDIFVHAKCDNMGQLFDFCKHYMHCFPEDSILEFEDIYGFDYKNGRDISGFMINMTNRCKPEGLKEVAVECQTGGSYALTQKWVHDFCVVDNDPHVLEQYIGREMISGREQENKSITSHVARMIGSTEKDATPPHEIVRQTQSYGSFSEKAGLFFLAFAADPCAFEYMLDRMVGAGCDGEHDDVMKMSRNVKGNYWYFPGVKELETLRQR